MMKRDEKEEPRDRWFVLFVLTAVYTLNIADRFVVSTLVEPIKLEFSLTDGQVGILTGAALAIFYVTAGIPLGVLADRSNRKRMIALSLIAWSILTAVCGFTKNFWQLLVARVFVGIGEAGGTPPSQALLCDKFRPAKRGLAMSLYSLGAALGAALGASLGGFLNDAFGWRAVLIIFGALGIPLAMLVLISVREPRRGNLDDDVETETVTIVETLRFVARQPALLHILAGASVVTLWGWGLVWWTPAFLLRSHAMSLSESGVHLGLMHAVGGSVVTLTTAGAMHWLSRHGPRRQANFVAIATLVPTIPSIVAYATTSSALSTAMLWLFVPMIYLYIGPTLALASNLVPAGMRSQTCAFILFSANVANLAVAPIVVGEFSDLLAPHLSDPTQSLRYVLMGLSISGFWGAWHFWVAGRYLVRMQASEASATLAKAVG